MTLADRKISPPKRTWLDRLRSTPAKPQPATYSAPAPRQNRWSALQKPHGDMADLLIMSTVDHKAPPNVSGSADLLDALVQEHLEHGGQAAPSAADDTPMIASSPSEAELTTVTEPEITGPALSTDERAQMLQREIEMLLQDTPADAAAAPAGVLPSDLPPADAPAPTGVPAATVTQEPEPLSAASLPEVAPVAPSIEAAVVADATIPESPVPQLAAQVDAPPATPPAQVAAASAVAEEPQRAAASVAPRTQSASPAADTLPPQLSREELDTLLSQTPEEAPAVKTDAESPAASVVTDSEAEQKLTEAEGVLAEELAKLMAESTAPAAAAPASAEPAATPEVQADAGLAEELAKLMAAPASLPGQSTASGEASASTVASAPAATVSSATAPAGTSPKPAPGASAVAPEVKVELLKNRQGLFGYLSQMAAGLMLMLAQLLDLPFGWLDDLSKNVIGMAAFLLLLGGAALWLLSHLAVLGG